MSRTRLILMPSRPGEPAPYLTLDSAGLVLERGRVALDQPAPPGPHRTVAVVPGSGVTARRLTLPAGTPAQRRAAALWALRDQLATPAERLTAALGPVEADGACWVAVASDALIAGWTDWLGAAGLRNAVLIPDMMAVDRPQDDGLTAVGFGGDLALRGQDLAATVQADLAETVAAGRAIRPVEDPAEVEAMLIRAALNPPLDLAAGASRARGGDGLGSWRRVAVLAGLLLASPVVIAAAEAIRDDMAARDLNARAEAAARRAFPDMPAGSDPVAEADRRLTVAPPPGGVAAAAAALFKSLEAVEGAELDSLTADPEGGVRATVTYAAYQDLDALKSGMEAQGLSLIAASTVDDAGRVTSDVVIGAAQ